MEHKRQPKNRFTNDHCKEEQQRSNEERIVISVQGAGKTGDLEFKNEPKQRP
jgi:hypothetical protein